jgi:hypothetical protein
MAHGAIALVLAACGGGGDGGIGGTGTTPQDVSVGTITNFGSVWVNGVRFNSDDATIKRDDDIVDKSTPLDRKGGLRRGMIARVDGSLSNAKADIITVESAVKGRVESVTGTTQMVIMGQTVLLDSATVFEDNVRPAAGDYAEVHGLVIGDGQISAGFVERKTTLATPPFVVHGIVKNQAGSNFNIGSLLVTLGAGAITNDMPSGSWNGLLVEVKGSTCAGTPPVSPCGTLTASKVEPDGPRGDIAKIELAGFVTQVNATGFNLGTQPVVTTGATFVGGLPSEVVVGTKLEVEGSLSGGIFTAIKVSFRENVRFEANIASASGGILTLQGLGGITIETNSLTKYSGNATSFADLANNQNVRVRGRPGSGSTVVATEVEVRSANPDSDVRFQAVASAAADPNLTMLGLTVNTSQINQFQDVIGNPISRAAFFNAIGTGGKLVKVRGTLIGASINWNREAELED